ncbi:OmpW family outer membrane protein [uncultured Kushneria sp.]|uniref:OmpW/AlkL family protein n=1 Tax=uncultured Kushneria sp. TaxID=905033 RepID=UPI002608C48E|nr:OmpW family outer membrane protein [uncultured Kushneria sp.]
MTLTSGHFKTFSTISAVIVSFMLPLTTQAASHRTALSPTGLQQGNWLIRLKATSLMPVNESSQTTPLGGQLETPSRRLPTLGVSYFLTDQWSVEAMAGVISTDYRLTDSLLGDLDISRVKSATVSLVAQYHFRPDAALKPYLGAGVNHTWPISVEPASGVPDIDMEALTSPLLEAGLDYRLSEHWFASASVGYVITPAQHFSGEGFSAKSDTDVLTAGAGVGVGLRF